MPPQWTPSCLGFMWGLRSRPCVCTVSPSQLSCPHLDGDLAEISLITKSQQLAGSLGQQLCSRSMPTCDYSISYMFNHTQETPASRASTTERRCFHFCCYVNLTKSSLEKKRVYLIFSSKLQPITEGDQGKDLKRTMTSHPVEAPGCLLASPPYSAQQPA